MISHDWTARDGCGLAVWAAELKVVCGVVGSDRIMVSRPKLGGCWRGTKRVALLAGGDL